jgi:PIN domain nuclease of toxin-antitoxin system
VFLSPVSLWEALVKYRLGKLPLPENPEVYLPRQCRLHQIDSLPLDEASVQHLASLPDLHRDPFDRMLICQALEHGLTLATVDAAIKSYPVNTF